MTDPHSGRLASEHTTRGNAVHYSLTEYSKLGFHSALILIGGDTGERKESRY